MIVIITNNYNNNDNNSNKNYNDTNDNSYDNDNIDNTFREVEQQQQQGRPCVILVSVPICFPLPPPSQTTCLPHLTLFLENNIDFPTFTATQCINQYIYYEYYDYLYSVLPQTSYLACIWLCFSIKYKVYERLHSLKLPCPYVCMSCVP